MDLSSFLPQSVITAMGYSRETINCLAVRQSDDSSFYPIAHDCPTEDGLVSSISCYWKHVRGSFA